jgi:hypothetical protein
MRAGIACLALLLGLAGCDGATLPGGIPNPFAKPQPSAKPVAATPSPSTPVSMFDVIQAKKRANAGLLREMMLVVFMKQPKDVAEFNSYLSVLQQGATFEGIYNGFTHSSTYRQLEITNRGATPIALKTFGEELAALEADLPQATEFTAASALPLAKPVMPEFVPDRPTPSAAPAKVLTAEEYSHLFVGASIFTLKRVLGDEALKVVATKKDFPGKLALWYSDWVVKMCGRGVDFGLPDRNRADAEFHNGWALRATLDQLEWEVLNRVHRILNEANKKP